MGFRPGYKQTELGPIPDDWSVKPAKRLGIPVRGGSPRPAGDPRYFNGSYIPWLTVAALTNIPTSQLTVTETSTYLTEAGSSLSRTLNPGTLIIANSGATLGVAKILGIKCCANDGIAALLDISKDVSPHYLAHFINAKTNYLREVVATGNGQPNLNTTLIGNFTIPLPPTKAEQDAIAEALGDADAFAESLEQLIAKKRAAKQGAMQALLTGKKRLRGFENARGFKQTEAGVIPEDWDSTSLGELGHWKGGATPSMRNPEYWLNGTIPWVSSGDVKSTLILDAPMKITESAVNESSTTLLPPHSIMIVTRSGILRRYLPVAKNTLPLAINQDIKALIPNDKAIPNYLLHLLISSGPRILATCLKSGTTVESIEFPWLKAFQVPLPPTKSEQEAIAVVLDDMDAEIYALEAKLAKTRHLKQGMMQELLTGRTRLV
jgi:type I restriction enzyme S subunit